MTHPHRLKLGELGEQDRFLVGGLEFGLPVLAGLAPIHYTSEAVGDELVAIANAEHRHTQFEEAGVKVVGIFGVDRSRSAGENHRRRVEGRRLGGSRIPRNDLGKDVSLPNSARNQLSILGTEIDDQDSIELSIVWD
jgi:hypothetical protein